MTDIRKKYVFIIVREIFYMEDILTHYYGLSVIIECSTRSRPIPTTVLSGPDEVLMEGNDTKALNYTEPYYIGYIHKR